MKCKNINYCFSKNLSAFNDKLDFKRSTDLMKQWHTVPKAKQKLYYKLYYQLLKFQIIKPHNNKAKTDKWVCTRLKNSKPFRLLNHPFLYDFAKYNSFTGKHLKGYTRHGEKVYSMQTCQFKNLYTYYNKLKKYYS